MKRIAILTVLTAANAVFAGRIECIKSSKDGILRININQDRETGSLRFSNNMIELSCEESLQSSLSCFGSKGTLFYDVEIKKEEKARSTSIRAVVKGGIGGVAGNIYRKAFTVPCTEKPDH